MREKMYCPWRATTTIYNNLFLYPKKEEKKANLDQKKSSIVILKLKEYIQIITYQAI